VQFLPDRVLISLRNGNERLLEVLALELSLQVDGSCADESLLLWQREACRRGEKICPLPAVDPARISEAK
jgi:hypothetical protein